MQILLLVLQMVPSIIATIKAIEAAVPKPGAGAEKRDLVLDIIKEVVGEVDGLIPVVTKVIALVVAMFNKSGTFTTTTPVVAP